MPPHLFITGVTGYIGGDALALMTEKHPDWTITCLVRNSDKGAKVAAKFATVKLVYGDLDSVELIEEEASKSDIVYHFANCDHEASAHAITKGLARRTGSNPSFWIHTSGSMILGLESIMDPSKLGEQLPKVYNDWDGIHELISFPYEAPHRPVDEIVLEASETHPNIRTAIVCPPTIYGVGRGPDNQRSMQAYRAAEFFMRYQKAILIGKGQNIWHQVHVHDLSQLYLLLGEAAAAGGPPATWNNEGYYLAENGEFVWGEVLREIAKVAHKQGFLPTNEVISLTPEQAAEFARPHRAHIGLGSNSRGVSIRAKKLLNWKPVEKSLKDTVPEIVNGEAKLLGLLRGHAEKVEDESI